jgi:RimJ/RimL family protein N-acetyltransferase
VESTAAAGLTHQPTLRTQRLLLRPFALADASRVQLLAGAREVYATTLNIPHPYADGLAEQWIASHAVQFNSGDGATFAITLAADGELVGAIGLRTHAAHRRAELGYWIGVPFWNEGYCTEAAIAVIRYGFEGLNLHKITSRYMAGNLASERVMVKAGMRKEGELIDEIYKDGAFRSLGVYGLVKA